MERRCIQWHSRILLIFLNADVGIIQMACPEFCCLGIDRGNIYGADSPVVENTRIRIEMKRDYANAKLNKLADYAVQQILEYDNLRLLALLRQIVLQIVV